jgi:hypothetical protein
MISFGNPEIGDGHRRANESQHNHERGVDPVCVPHQTYQPRHEPQCGDAFFERRARRVGIAPAAYDHRMSHASESYSPVERALSGSAHPSAPSVFDHRRRSYSQSTSRRAACGSAERLQA